VTRENSASKAGVVRAMGLGQFRRQPAVMMMMI
jgi:hypothetical protein